MKDVTIDATSAAISASVIALAHQLGLNVIAEGVETEAQLAFLERNGCDECQGYYFGKPVSVDAMLERLTRNEPFAMPPKAGVERTLLVVDDDAAVLSALSRLLRTESFRVLVAQSGREALELLASNEVRVVMSDERMPEMTGGEFFRRIRVQYPDVFRIILSGCVPVGSLVEEERSGIIDKFLSRPWNEDELRAEILSAFELQVLRRRRRRAEDVSV